MLRILVGAFLIVVIVEGAIRKWVLPEYGTEVFVLKDVVLAFAFAAYALQRQYSAPRSLDIAVWFMWVPLVVGHAIAPGLSLETLVGLRYYLAPLPLILLVPALIHDATDLDRVAAWAVRLSFPIGILAIIQYYSPLDSPLNTYAWGGEGGIASFGVEDEGFYSGLVRPRVTATFSYISTYAAFLGAAWILAWLSLLHGRARFDRWLAGLALILIAFNMGMNGSRALLLVAIVTGLPFAVALIRELGTFRSQLLVVGFVLAIGYFGATIFEPFALTAERGDTEEATGRITGTLLTPFATLSEIDWLGTGVGSTFGGYEQIGHRAVEGFDEVNVDRVGIELGVFGYLFLLVAKLLMLAKAFAVYRRAPAGRIRHWAMAALLVQLSAVWQIPFYNSIAAIYYFCAIGLVYWLDGETKRLGVATALAPGRQGRALPARGWR